MSITRIFKPRTFSSLAQVASPEWRSVAFEHEDLQNVAREVPDFNFYEFPELQQNPYKDANLATPILDEEYKPPVDQTIKYSKLENGLRIVSVDKGNQVANLGLFVHSGSRFEDPTNAGVSHMIELMAYRSTAHLSHLRTAKTFEQLGVKARCEVGRESTVYKADVLREYMPVVVPLLVGNVLFPRLLNWEVTAAHAKMKDALNHVKSQPDSYVRELIHEVAFHNNTLGNLRFATPAALKRFTGDNIRNHMMQHFSPDKMVFVGVNVDHEELSKWLMRSFVDYNAIPSQDHQVQAPRYTGGYRRIGADLPYLHIALGFNIEGGWNGSDAVALSVLQTILGRVAPRTVGETTAFSHLYTDAGIFGLYGMVEPSQAESWVVETASMMKNLSFSTSDFHAAKAALSQSVAESFDDSGLLVEELGNQIILGGKVATFAEINALIENVSESDVSRAASYAFSSKPTVVSYGDVSYVPHYDDICSMLN